MNTNIEVTQTINVKIKGADYALTALEATALYNALGCALNMKTTWDNPKNPNQPWQPMPYMPYKFPNDIWYYGIPPVSSTGTPNLNNLCGNNVTTCYTSDNWNKAINTNYTFNEKV